MQGKTVVPLQLTTPKHHPQLISYIPLSSVLLSTTPHTRLFSPLPRKTTPHQVQSHLRQHLTVAVQCPASLLAARLRRGRFYRFSSSCVTLSNSAVSISAIGTSNDT
jgi:hypothetical protein